MTVAASRHVPPDYPARIRGLRQRMGLTQARLAALMGVSFASVNRWENGQTRPSALAWQQLARAELLGLPAFDGGVAPEVREPVAEYVVEPVGPPATDFSSDPEVVRLVAEAERLSYGHLFNPAFATETALIEPLPHQRIAVYGRMLPQPRLRFLLADDAGAGKTIMTGLYVREMLTRRLIRRVLIAVPAGLVGNWEREMRTLFALPFRIVSGTDARLANPFVGPEADLAIVKVDTLAGERTFSRLQDPAVAPYDLVVFDEAHKLSANREPDLTVRKIDRYHLAEALAGASDGDARWALDWAPRHLLLLTATPHMGPDYPYFALWRLLEPEVLSTLDAFHSYPVDARQRHFTRRTKEEMVRFDGSAIYPTRISDTLSYELSQGEVSEQRLYEQTTDYIRSYYNRAELLNRSAARLAMSIFQRRLASSTYALLRSFERRLAKLNGLIDDVASGKIRPQQLHAMQRRLGEEIKDVFEERTGDEESSLDGREENEVAEDQALAGVVAVSLAELQTERHEVERLLKLARQVYERGEESKFERLRELLVDPEFKDHKLILFTEHRDTLEFLVRRLEGLGFTGRVAQIHGGMDYREREQQVEFFRRPEADDGATYLVATDAAGEGINLQFCWLMANYDIPWNPARLEQRMGRIHRYGQQHEVRVMNLLAGKTREGRVLKTLLDKLERIRRELRSDKVFDVVGRLFEGVSLKEYMRQALDEEHVDKVQGEIEGRLTKAQVQAVQERERGLYGQGGDVRAELPGLKQAMEREQLRCLLPGYVRRFVERAAPLLDIGIEGDLEREFSLRALKPGALDALWPVLEAYPSHQRDRMTVYKRGIGDPGIFLHPGEPLFDRLRALALARFAEDALRGAVFVDPYAERPYLFHLASITVSRQADTGLPALARSEVVECRLVGMKHEQGGQVEACPVEHLLLLKGGSESAAPAGRLAARVEESRELARAYALEHGGRPLAEARRRTLLESLAERESFLARGYDYQDAELAAARVKVSEKARQGNSQAKGALTRIREQQRALERRKEEALAVLRREPELIAPEEVVFLAHALVVPSSDPEERKRHDAEVEALAMRVACAYEEAHAATVSDVSSPERARAAGLTDCPGFDLRSVRASGEQRLIEVKGRAGIGDVELTENEWAAACNHRGRYWLYVVYECASSVPRLLRIGDPFGKLVVKAKGGVIIDEREILAAAE